MIILGNAEITTEGMIRQVLDELRQAISPEEWERIGFLRIGMDDDYISCFSTGRDNGKMVVDISETYDTEI